MINETIIFLSYILVCTALFKRRFSLRATIVAFAAAAAIIAGVNAAIIMFDGASLALTMLPVTAYLPFSVLLYFLSDCGVFETLAVCSVGMLDVLILKLLNKILLAVFNTTDIYGYVLDAINIAVLAIMAAGFEFIAIRLIGKAFRLCVIDNRQNRLLLSVPIILIFLLIFYFLNSTTETIVLIFTMLIALSIFFIIAKLLISSAELMRLKRMEKELSEHMDIQRHSYDTVIRKMEAGRVYRHDMRHHLAIIDGLAKQGECGKIIEYTGKLNGTLSEIENVNYCKNPVLNAVLSEYISRAENAGCKVTESIALSEKLPFEDSDVCAVLANSVENAINACAKLPKEKRYINISAESTDDSKLFVLVRNPCAEPVKFDEEGLPISNRHREEHGIGLCSVKRVAEKYNGFLRCRLENGEFVFQAALFSTEDPRKNGNDGVKHESVSKRAMTSLLGLGAGVLLTLNVLPAVADAVSSLLSVNILTIKSFRFGLGDNSLSADYPVFDGNGSEGLNSAVTNCIDKAREKFMWYFNRRYNGYVAEDTRYTVIRDDEKYLTVQFTTTINAGGSMDFSRWIIFDKSAGKVLELADMFKDGSDYIGVISDEILRQMRYKNENEGAGFFIEGSAEDGMCFSRISEDANFYIDSYDRLVIVFDEYEVAPGFMGSPEFIIPDNIMEEIAR